MSTVKRKIILWSPHDPDRFLVSSDTEVELFRVSGPSIGSSSFPSSFLSPSHVSFSSSLSMHSRVIRTDESNENRMGRRKKMKCKCLFQNVY